MSSTLVHRGPDDEGIWVDDSGRVGLAFRRLSIQDLSPNGHQPMSSPSGRYKVVFNGEIYNHQDLRRRLAGHGYTFRGHSDTETICAGFEEWGVAETVSQSVGMFAIGVWDGEDQSLYLIRDRLGIKPLHVYTSPECVVFGSELKTLMAHSRVRLELDTAALGMYLRYLYVPTPYSIFTQIRKVRPGTIVQICAGDLKQTETVFWSIADAYARGTADPFTGSEEEAAEELERILTDAVEMRKLADVPIGALLSGGVDSSVVVALMQRNAVRPTRTFAIGFDVSEHDETAHAAAIARHLETDHTPLAVSGQTALDVVPELPLVFDEPLADPSQIPTLIVSRLARESVTVVLTGDGGDEVFGGYNRYTSGHRLIEGWNRAPRAARAAAAAALRTLSGPLYPLAAPVLERGVDRLPREKLAKLGRMLAQGTPSDMYRSLLSAWQTDDIIPDPAERHHEIVLESLRTWETYPSADWMMLVDQLHYLPDDLLAKLDRASMAVGLEARVPLLDHRVLEFAWRLPMNQKIRGRVGKYILRRVLYRHVPVALVNRPKVGFSVPVADWLKGPLKDWSGDLLSEVAEPLNSALVQRAWRNFRRGRTDAALSLWTVLMFQAWRSAWKV